MITVVKAIPLVLACLGDANADINAKDCRIFRAAPEMPLTQCVAGGPMIAGNFMSRIPGDWTFRGITCMEPRQAEALLQQENI